MDQQELRELEHRCIQECAPWCTAQCPVHVDVKAMTAAVRDGDFDGAFAVLQKKVSFPGIIGLICDHPCQAACRRNAVDETVSIRALERAAFQYSSQKRIPLRPLPGKGKKVAIVGAGLSGLTAALELIKKGHAVVLFEATFSLGGSVWSHPKSILPRKVIQDDFALVRESPIAIRYGTVLGRDILLSDLEEQYDAVYLGVGPFFRPPEEIEVDEQGRVTVDPVTFQTSRSAVLAGGSLVSGEHARSPVRSISDGKRAAVSIDRYLQKVSLSASRDKEGPYRTRLFTSVEGVEHRSPVHMLDPVYGLAADAAVQEAARCLQCECMECVKVCEYLAAYKGYPRKYVRQVYNNLSIVAGQRHGNLMINSCSLCGLCKEVCPEDLHMGEVCKSARELMAEQDRMPPSAHEFALRDMAFSTGEHFWLARNEPGTAASAFLFFPGCRLSAASPEHVKKTYAHLRERLDGGVGIMLSCCGAPADWSGRTERFEEAFTDLVQEWERMGKPVLITACSTCTGVFAERLPGKVVTLWEIIDGLDLPEVSREAPAEILTIHDPCTARHLDRAQESVRSILHKLGYETSEPSLSRNLTECCGFGGLMLFADRALAQRVVQRRIDTVPGTMLAYCAMCRDRFASQGKPTLHILDLIFGQSTEAAAWDRGPDYSQGLENRARLKRSLLSELWKEETGVTQKQYQGITLHISDPVRQLMEERMILVEDLQQVLQWAEETGNRLVHREAGRYLAHYRPGTVTYWVEYSPADDGYTVHNAYSHRMHIEEGVKA